MQAGLGRPEKTTYGEAKKPSIIVNVSLGRKLFPKKMPSKLEGEIILRGRLARNWKVHTVEGFLMEEPKQPMKDQVFPDEYDPKSDVFAFSLESLQASKEYQLVIHLRPTNRDAPIEEALEEIPDSMKVFFSSKKVP